MGIVTSFFESFIGVFEADGENLMGLITGILPTLACLMTFVMAIVKLIGEERIEKLAQKGSKNVIMRYTVLPILSYFVFTNPMNFALGRFLPEKYKGPFFDACCTVVHPMTGLFPHVNSGELFIWLGIASGIEKLGYATTSLAVRYFVIGVILAFIRGVVVEKIWMFYAKKKEVSFRDSNGITI